MIRTATRMGRGVHRRCGNLPTNQLIERLRAQPEVRWTLIASAVLVPAYCIGGWLAAEAAAGGGPGWLHLCVACWYWNAMKFAWLAVIRVLSPARIPIRSRA